MNLTKREIIIEAISKDTYGIKSPEGIWYNILDGDKKRIKPIFSKLTKGDSIELEADFQLRIYKEIVIKKKSEKKSGNWSEDMVKFEDLLNEGHKRFPKLSITTEKIEIDLKQKYALFKAAISPDRNSSNPQLFEAHGDATADNIGTDYVKPHFIRLAETRAIVRALRLLTNNAKVAVEETEKGEDSLEGKGGK